MPAATHEQIDKLWEDMAGVDASLILSDRTQTQLNRRVGYRSFVEHCCRSSKYFFEIKKCGNSHCEICGPTTMEADLFAKIKPFPDPVPSENGLHFKSFGEVYGTKTSQDHCPSLGTSACKMKASTTVVGNVTLKKETVRNIVKSVSCNKPRCVFAAKKLPPEQSKEFHRVAEDYEYSCGAELLPTGHPLHDVVVLRPALSCSVDIEWVYVSAR